MAARDPLVRRLSAIKASSIAMAQRTDADNHARMAHARATRDRNYIEQADPDGSLRAAGNTAELERRVRHLRRAWMADLTRRSIIARRERAAQARQATTQREAEAEAALDAALDVLLGGAA